MGIYHVFFIFRTEEYDLGCLILEWTPEQDNSWVGTWVDNIDELYNYKYKRESLPLKTEVIARLFIERAEQVYRKSMKRQQDNLKDDWKNWNHLQSSDAKPYLN